MTLRIKINHGARLFLKFKNNLTQWLNFFYQKNDKIDNKSCFCFWNLKKMAWSHVNKKNRNLNDHLVHILVHFYVWESIDNVFSISVVEKRRAGPSLDSVDAPQVPPNVRRRSRDTSSITSQRISQLAHRISAFVDEGTVLLPTNKHACSFLVCIASGVIFSV